jgi:Archaeal flagella protein
MAVNPAQKEVRPATAPTSNAEERLLKIQDDVELLKTSIKKLLIDIRERMNEKDNPFLRLPPDSGKGSEVHIDLGGTREAGKGEKPASKPEPAAQEMTEPPDTQGLKKVPSPSAVSPPVPGPVEHQILQMMKEQGAGPRAQGEKLRLQKVHRLFEWTGKIVNRYGHDRLEMMLQAYSNLGYISRDAVAQVKEIARLMPATLGEIHEVGPDAFVSELYVLNRILDPNDTSLDRDMIEVLMSTRRGDGQAEGTRVRKVAEEVDEWIRTLDQI